MNDDRIVGAVPRRYGIGAIFDAETGRRASRALQEELGLSPSQVSVTQAPQYNGPGDSAVEGHLRTTSGGAILIYAKVDGTDDVEKAGAIFERLGGKIVPDETPTGSVGGYGPTTAHGMRGVFGTPATTSSMAPHIFTEAPSEGQEKD